MLASVLTVNDFKHKEEEVLDCDINDHDAVQYGVGHRVWHARLMAFATSWVGALFRRAHTARANKRPSTQYSAMNGDGDDDDDDDECPDDTNGIEHAISAPSDTFPTADRLVDPERAPPCNALLGDCDGNGDDDERAPVTPRERDSLLRCCDHLHVKAAHREQRRCEIRRGLDACGF